jgi:hypothetical protein
MLLSGSDLGELPCGLWMEMVSQLDLSVNNLISTVLLDLGRLPALAVVLNLLRNRLSEDLPPKLGSLPTTASTTSSTRSCSSSRLSARTHCVPQQCGFLWVPAPGPLSCHSAFFVDIPVLIGYHNPWCRVEEPLAGDQAALRRLNGGSIASKQYKEFMMEARTIGRVCHNNIMR